MSFWNRRSKKMALKEAEAERLHRETLKRMEETDRRLTKPAAVIQATGIAEMIYLATPGGGDERRRSVRRREDKE